MAYAFIDPETGSLFISSGLPDGIGFWWDVEDGLDPNALAVNAAGELVGVPVRREVWLHHDPDTGEWIDTRTPEQIEAAMSEARQRAAMARTAFCVACARLNIISEGDAVNAARGDIPAPFLPVFEAMDPDERFDSRVRWAGAATVSRTDPIVLACAAHIGMTDSELDDLFGVK